MHVILEGGIVGAGKSQAQKYLVKALRDDYAQQPFAISTDKIRRDLPWVDPFRRDDSFRKDEDTVAKIAFAYNLMYACVARRAEKPRVVAESLSKDAGFLMFADQCRSVEDYLIDVQRRNDTVAVCEAPFFPPHHLSRFYDAMHPKPILIEVGAQPAIIRERIVRRKKGDSKASLNVFEVMSAQWKTMKELGYHAHVIDNSGTPAQLKHTIDVVLDEIHACKECPPRNL